VTKEILEHPTTSNPGNYILGYHPYKDNSLYKAILIY